MPIRAILFDHDGTLVDSEPQHLRAWQAVLTRFEVKLTEHDYKSRYAGVPTIANAKEMVGRYQLDIAPNKLAEAKNAATRAHLALAPFPLMPGVLETIVSFEALRLQMAVVTGASAVGVQATLDGYSLRQYFPVAVSGDDVSLSKPAPDCYLLALQRLALNASDCIAIEDTEHGLQAANAAGIKCIVVPTHMSHHHDFRLALARADSMAEACHIVQRHI
jgi:HAD superfamily hydrolase (TIGR01509 family)